MCQIASAQAPVADFSSNITAGCSPVIVNFQDKSTGTVASYQWDFGNGGTSTLKNPSAIYFSPGAYTVSLTVTNAANQTNTKTKTAYVVVYDPPVADFSVDKTSGCSPTNIKFTDRSVTPPGTVVTSWKWDFGDGGSSTSQNPSYSYKSPGTYSVTLSITNDKGCTKLVTKANYIDVSDGVYANFNYIDPNVCSAPATFNFTNNSSGPGTLNYKWDLGNGNKPTTTNASTVYSKNGTYRVSLVVLSSQGCVDSSEVVIEIGKVITDFIVPSAICPKTPVQFLNNGNPRPISSTWRFSNGTTDTLKNGITTFKNPGNYSVTLINKYNVCTDSLTKNITVVNGPVINFSSLDTGKCQAPFLVNFNNSSNAVSYVWDFGDSTSSTDANPLHNYLNNGDYTVTLIGTTANGCRDTLTKPANIKIRRPVISFPNLPIEDCIPSTQILKANIQSADPITSYKWDFGDGQSSTSIEPSHTYAVQGAYTVSLTITTKGGCTETLSLPQAVTVGTKPIADFSAVTTNACADPGIQFINLSKGGNKYSWDFSDGSSDFAFAPKHVFLDTGWIDVTLVVFNSGCQDKITKNKFVYIRPTVAQFNYLPDCNNKLQYTFTDKSISANSWNWNFGDGTSYIGQNPPTHVFPGTGKYKVSLTASNGTCTYTVTREVEIRNLTPDFISSTLEGCKSYTPIMYPNLPDAGLIKTYIWDFGDGSSPIDFGHGNFGQYTYVKAGNYNVSLTTIDTFGCKHTITKNSFIRVNGPQADFSAINNSGCKGITATFLDSSKSDGVNKIVNWKWDFGDSTSKTYTTGPFDHRYDSVGDYDIKLVVTDTKGCKDSLTKRELVKISTLKAIWVTRGETCPNSDIGFGNQTLGDLPFTTLWKFGDGQTSTERDVSHKYADTGLYTVSLYVEDLLGCIDSSIKVNSVKVALPNASFTANNFATYCTPFEARFQNTSTFYESSNWDLSQATSNQQNPSLFYTSPGVYPIKLTVTSPGGCTDTISQNLTVYNENDAKITYDPTVGCRPLKVNLEAFTQLNARFIWDFGDGNVVDTTINTITHIYDNPGTFTPKIVLKESEGCIIPLQGQQEIQVNGAKAIFGINRRLFCDSGYIAILDSTLTTSRDPITKYTWDFGDGSISNNKVPVHNYTSPGNYTVALFVETQIGCKDTLISKPPVKVVASPLITIAGDTVICINQKMNHLGIFLRQDTSVVRWNWQLANNKSSNLQNPLPQTYTAGKYTINSIAVNSSGCADTAQQNIVVNPLPVITMASTLTKVVGFPLTIPVNYSSNVTSYQWFPANSLNCSDCPIPITTTKFNTKYVISVIDSNGCVNASEVQVIVLCKGVDLFVPNSFSPNGDGSNDVFYPRGKGIERIRALRIFNRWGEVVFEKREFPINDPSAGWDGFYKGQKQPGVYIYQAEVICENGEIIRFDGNIALIL